MKNLWARWLALGLMLTTLIVIIQGPQQLAEAKKIKIKKVLKELKKLKKYGYLLAYQRKKLYAIPFPMPLPIFVKRQHIYTTIPIIPRYIQHPQHSSSSSHGGSSYSSMASSSSETSAAASPPPSYESMSMYMPESSSPSSSSMYQSMPSKSSSYASILGTSYGIPTRTKSKKHNLLDQSSYTSAIPSSSKYLAQLASVLGQGSLAGSSTNKDILTKIMNGQAKILAPTSLLSAIKGPSSALLNLYQQQTGSSSSAGASSSASSSTNDEQETKTGEPSSSSSSDETSGSSAVTKSQDSSSSSSSSSSEANKPSASEIHKSRYKPYMVRTPYGRIPPAAANMIASMNPAAVMGSGMMPPPPHPFAMMAPQSSALMQRIPMLQPAGAQLMGAGNYMPAMVYPQAAVYPIAGQLAASASDQMESQSSDINENYAAPNDNQEQRNDELIGYRAALMMQQRQQQALLRLALIKERERELVESSGQQQSTMAQKIRAAQILAYYKQQQQQRQQQLQQLEQLHQLHRHRQHQQQLQQNTIDR